MKKSLLLASFALMLGALTSCDKENGSTSTMTYNVPTYNLVTSQDPTAAPSVESSVYKFTFDMMNATATIGTDFKADGESISFVTNPIGYNAGFFIGEDSNKAYEVIWMESMKQGSLNNIAAQISEMAYFPLMDEYGNISNVDGLPAFTVPANMKYLTMSYNIDDIHVTTFWNDVTFRGNTTTQYTTKEGLSKSFVTKGIKYRVIMDPAKLKAKVIIYDAQFAQEMTMSIAAIVVDNLDLEFNNSGYTIKGKDIVPTMAQSGKLIPMQEFIFDEFDMTTGGDLTSTSISYKVAHGAYMGYFEGSHIPVKTNNSGE